MSSQFVPSFRFVVRVLVLFLLLSAADLFLTWKLIHTGDGRALESNPVANWWLTQYGWKGMAGFKLAVFLVVGGLTGAIAFWRPRTSELLLVFACGAQSSVVLYSVFLMRLAEDPADAATPLVVWTPDPALLQDAALLPENGSLLLLGNRAVQEEIGLSEAQVQAVRQTAEKRHELRMRFASLSREDRRARIRQQVAQEKALTDELSSEQAERLRQIAWQQRGPLAFADADVSAALALTTEQKDSIRSMLEETRRPRPFPVGPGRNRPGSPWRAEEDNRARNQLWTILTVEQKERWTEMLGKPFKGDLNPRPERGDGPGRDPRRGPR